MLRRMGRRMDRSIQLEGRGAGRRLSTQPATRFTIAVDPPFRLDLTVWALRRRSINQTDLWDGSEYTRVICAGQTAVRLDVRQVDFGATPKLLLRMSGTGDHPQIRETARRMLNHILGLRLNLGGFYAMAAQSPQLHDLAQRFRGMRPPRFPSVFEALVNGIACQQISLQAGLTLLNRLVAAFGKTADASGAEVRAFPTPGLLAVADPRLLQSIGFSHAKSVAIRKIAIAVAQGGISYAALEGLDDATARIKLDELRGVGRWTAEYVLLRGCGRLNIFPGDDVGARNNLQRWLGRRSPLTYDRTIALLRRWQPYAGLLYLHLLLMHLEEQGTLKATVT